MYVVIVVAVKQIAFYLTNFFSIRSPALDFKNIKNIQRLLARQNTDKKNYHAAISLAQKLPR